MTAIYEDFPALSGIIGGCLHQDMDTVPHALAGYARLTEPDEKRKLFDDIKTFLERHHNDLESSVWLD